MLQDYKLGLRMLLKYPGLTMCRRAGARHCDRNWRGWYDFVGKVLLADDPAA